MHARDRHPNKESTMASSPKPSHNNETLLISELSIGSKKAFDTIYQMYASRLFAFCLRYTKSAFDAEEIVENTFVRLWLNRRNLKRKDSIKPILFTICRHELIDIFRKRIKTPEYVSYLECKEQMAIEQTDSHLEYDEFVKRMNQVIDKLSPTQQRVLRLSKLRGLRNEEIVAETGLSMQTVKNQLSLALKRLRKELGGAGMMYFIFFEVLSIE